MKRFPHNIIEEIPVRVTAGCKTNIPRNEKENHPLKSIPSNQGSASVWVAGSQAGLRTGWLSSCTSQDPCHFLWQQTENQQNNHTWHLQLFAKSYNTEYGKLAKLFPSFHETGTSSDWSAAVWTLENSCSAPEWRCSHTTPKSRESLCRNLPAVIIPFMLLMQAVLLQRGSCIMESPVSISALHLTQW